MKLKTILLSVAIIFIRATSTDIIINEAQILVKAIELIFGY